MRDTPSLPHGELSDEAVRYQAEAFLDWYRRAAVPSDIGWSRWAVSKGFSPADELRIKVAVGALR